VLLKVIVASDRKDGELLQRSLFYLELAIHLDPTNVGALNDRGYIALRIYQTENRDEALRFYTESVAADPKQQRARYNMAWIYHKNGNYAESIATVTEALSKIKWQLASDKARPVASPISLCMLSRARRMQKTAGQKEF
jgi:tetratricopeptide (TPR) repeat protein